MKFLDYIKGKRHGQDAHRTELDAMRDPLLGDALEGFDKVAGDHSEALDRLSARIAQRTSAGGGKASGRKEFSGKRSRRMRNWSVAAAVTILVCLAAGSLVYLRNEMDKGQELAQEPHKADKAPLDVVLPPVTVIPNDSTARDEKKDKQIIAQKIRAQESARSETVFEEEPVIAAERITVIREPLIEVSESEVPDDFEIRDNAIDFPEFAADIAASDTVQEETEAKEAVFGSARGLAAATVKPDTSTQNVLSTLQGQTSGVRIRGTASSKTRKADLKYVSGQVVDASTGEPLPGATVSVEGTSTGTITDVDGYFTLPQTDYAAKLRAQYLGYETEVAEIDMPDYMLIAMAPDNTALEEVVVVGYGTQKKTAITGSATRVEKAAIPAEYMMTTEFSKYLAEETAKAGVKGSASLEFEVNKLGRPYRIKTVASTSREAKNEAERILRDGPEWKPSEGKLKITITFGLPEE